MIENYALIFITWGIVAMKFGYFEALLFDEYPMLGLKYKYIHFLFTFLRALVSFVFIYYFEVHWTVIFPMMLCFPFLHDGTYYVTRNFYNPKIYRLGWKARSGETTAIISLRYKDRLFLFYIAMLVMTVIMIVVKSR